MLTIVTDATPEDLAKLSGVEWHKPTVESRVRWGRWNGAPIGIEVLRKMFAVHVPEATCAKLVDTLAERSVFGAAVWTEATGEGVPSIGGEPTADLIDGSAGVSVGKDLKKTAIDASTAKATLTAAAAVGVK